MNLTVEISDEIADRLAAGGPGCQPDGHDKRHDDGQCHLEERLLQQLIHFAAISLRHPRKHGQSSGTPSGSSAARQKPWPHAARLSSISFQQNIIA